VRFGSIDLCDIDLMEIAVAANTSRPKARAVLETAMEIELAKPQTLTIVADTWSAIGWRKS
jgi:hypothetical protein